MRKHLQELERIHGMKSYGIHRTRKAANFSKRGLIINQGGEYTVKKVPFRHFSSGFGFMTFKKN